ncbi:hypothetical protein CO661_28135 [Sinorhizobium fredii]|uniref:Uncharacterized protein n=1 Tax=Rhizobium fredii TaxID=380 RepID=A0A2A6LQL7_RHIFR|nr:hypothetical protein CO661_28135 [Sinorhizobium fredii]
MLKILSFLPEHSRRYFLSDPITKADTFHPPGGPRCRMHIPPVGAEGRLAFRCRLSHWAALDMKTEHKQSVKRA